MSKSTGARRFRPATRESYGLRGLAPHITAAMGGIGFTKMHGLGNDFVVIDARDGAPVIGEDQARAIADRRTGIGCNQLLVIEPPINGGAEAFMRIRNADGGEVAACGNGIRCVAAFLMAQAGSDRVVIETGAGLFEARAGGGGQTTRSGKSVFGMGTGGIIGGEGCRNASLGPPCGAGIRRRDHICPLEPQRSGESGDARPDDQRGVEA